MTFIQKFPKYWLPVILWMCFISWMSTDTFSTGNTSFWVGKILFLLFPGFSAEQAKVINFILRRDGHITEYFILSLLLFRAFRSGSTASWNWRWFWGTLIVVVLWAGVDEFHQSFVPSREASIVDAAIDTAGGILALFVIALWYHHKKNRNRNYSSL